MDLSPLTALSPLDGRYGARLAGLRAIFCESGLIRMRVLVEVRWLQALAMHPGITELPPFPPAANARLDQVVADFDDDAAVRIKTIEARTNHDVKAVEYYLQECMAAEPTLRASIPFLHFACTSEDINNIAYALMLARARTAELLPRMRDLARTLRAMAHSHAERAMLARTHGQTATPTTLGKEFAVFVHRLQRQCAQFEAVPILGKLNGAVGNFNAHLAAYPQIDWPALSATVIRALGLEPNPYTTQIEPHDWIAEYVMAVQRYNSVLLDLCRDLWGYVALGYFRQRAVAGEVGSSTMPHKINPIDFENAEGNLGLANALLEHLAAKLPISRWQRDLSDSTVLRSLGVALGHCVVAYESCARGLSRLEVDADVLDRDLDDAWEVLAEAIQTVMRRHGIADSYEQLKALTRGRRIDRAALAGFIAGLDLAPAEKARLQALTPATYVGLAADLARAV